MYLQKCLTIPLKSLHQPSLWYITLAVNVSANTRYVEVCTWHRLRNVLIFVSVPYHIEITCLLSDSDVGRWRGQVWSLGRPVGPSPAVFVVTKNRYFKPNLDFFSSNHVMLVPELFENFVGFSNLCSIRNFQFYGPSSVEKVSRIMISGCFYFETTALAPIS